MVSCENFKGEIYLIENIKTNEITFVDSNNNLQKKEEKIMKDIVKDCMKDIKEDRREEEIGEK